MDPVSRFLSRAFLVLLALAGGTGLLVAQHGHAGHAAAHAPGHSGDHHAAAHQPGVASADWAHLHYMMMAAQHHLELSEDQQEDLRQLHERFGEPAHESAQRMDHLRQLVTRAVHDERVDEAAIRQAARNLADEQESHFVRLATFLSEVRTVFTDDQLEHLHRMMMGQAAGDGSEHGSGG